MPEDKSIDVTQEMMAAGVEHFSSHTEDRFPESWYGTEVFVKELYEQMEAARQSPRKASIDPGTG